MEDFSTTTLTEAEQALASEATVTAPTPVSAAGPDINNLDQYNDVDDIDEGASVYDRALPPVDGWHQLRLKPVKDGIGEAKRFNAARYQGSVMKFEFEDRDGKHQVHFMIVLDQQIAEEGKQGNGQSAREWVSTMPTKVNEKTTSQVDTLLQVLTGKAGVGLSRLQKIDLLYQKLTTEPLANAKTQWIFVASDATPVTDRNGEQKFDKDGKEKTEYVTLMRGMGNFPEVNGVHQILEELPKDVTVRGVKFDKGTAGRTKFAIVDLRPLSEKVG